MKTWIDQFHYDPLAPLINSRNAAIRFFSQRDLAEQHAGSVEALWELPEVRKILQKQQPDGSWLYSNRQASLRTNEDYNQIETYRNLGSLVEKYGFDRRHKAIIKAADFLFTRQTDEGDFRGIYGNQYSPNYSAAIMELICKAGLAGDARIEHGVQWLISIRQNDGGWAVPLRTKKVNYRTALEGQEVIQPVRSQPFSHLITGIVLRLFAAHPAYRFSQEARTAGELLATRFFQADKYPDRRTPEYWTAFSFPFWFTDLLSALDSLSWLGFTAEQPQIKQGLDWFIERQEPDGTWNLKLLRTKDKDLSLWIGLMIGKVYKRFFER